VGASKDSWRESRKYSRRKSMPLFRRPGVVLLPLVAAGFEGGRFGLVELALAAEPVVEPGLEDVVAVIGAGIGAEIDGAEAAAVPFQPP
jgi:hypothetical protein